MRLARKQFRSNLKHIFGLACVLSISATIKNWRVLRFFISKLLVLAISDTPGQCSMMGSWKNVYH